jgi:hypothetical protein
MYASGAFIWGALQKLSTLFNSDPRLQTPAAQTVTEAVRNHLPKRVFSQSALATDVMQFHVQYAFECAKVAIG